MARKAVSAAPAAIDETVGFVPAVTFLGFPDGISGRWFGAGKQEEATAEYVELLQAKGLLVADAAVAENATEKEEK